MLLNFLKLSLLLIFTTLNINNIIAASYIKQCLANKSQLIDKKKIKRLDFLGIDRKNSRITDSTSNLINNENELYKRIKKYQLQNYSGMLPIFFKNLYKSEADAGNSTYYIPDIYEYFGLFSINELRELAEFNNVPLLNIKKLFLSDPVAIIITNTHEECADEKATLSQTTVFSFYDKSGKETILGKGGWEYTSSQPYVRYDVGERFAKQLIHNLIREIENISSTEIISDNRTLEKFSNKKTTDIINSTLSFLNITNKEVIFILEEILRMRTSIRNKINTNNVKLTSSAIDEHIIQTLPDIAKAFPQLNLFLDGITIEFFLLNLLIENNLFDENTNDIQLAFSLYIKLFNNNNDYLYKFIETFASQIKNNNQSLSKIKNSENFLHYIKKLSNEVAKEPYTQYKVIVLDCDNTLWEGIIGEDGLNGIMITNDYKNFQQKLKELKENGVQLAINSKNNLESVLEVFRNHPDMILKEDDFAVIKANWQDKTTNIQEIEDFLDLGISSYIFIDDSLHERELIKTIYPHIIVEDAAVLQKFPAQLDNFFKFDTPTEEDKNRTEYYRVQQKRKELLENSSNIGTFLSSLEMKLIIRENDSNFKHIRRLSQLTLRTNQFNMRTSRYEEEDIIAILSNSNQKVYSLELKDKFINDGIVGLIIIKILPDGTGYIDTFCLSCRVIGRHVAKAFLSYVIQKLREENNIHTLLAEHIITQRNKTVVSNFLNEFGYLEKFSEDIKDIYKLPLLPSNENFQKWLEIFVEDKNIISVALPLKESSDRTNQHTNSINLDTAA